jgi:uncharacterized protein
MNKSTPKPYIITTDTTDINISQAQCDCACASYIGTENTLKPITNTFYLFNKANVILPMDSEHYAIINPNANISIINHVALKLLNYFKSAKKLNTIPEKWKKNWGKSTEIVLKKMLQAGLLTPENSPSKLIETPQILSAWLHVTDRCNLRCSYCYLPHEKQDMSLETGKKAIKATFDSALQNNYQTVKLKYAGGEALLQFPLVIQLQHYALELAKKYQLKLDSVVLSNGILLNNEKIKQMQFLNLRLMISLDGLTEDKQRCYADGTSSHLQAQTAIKFALKNKLIPDVSVTVSSRNIVNLPPLVEWLLKHDLPFSLNFYRENNFSKQQQDLRLEEQQIIDGMLGAYKVIENNLPQRSLLASLVDRANLANPHLRTCAVGNSYLVFNQQGKVSKCQMQQQQTIATVDDSNLLNKIREDNTGIQNISVEEKEGCKECEWKYWCTGGCPLETYSATGRYDVKSPNCNIYKALYPKVLKLEGLRILKNMTM